MPKAIYSSGAKEDLRQITRYIARDNLAAAIAWLEKTQAGCDLLATQPAIGQKIKTRQFGNVRRHVAGSYLVYYRPTEDGVEILAVVHGARDQGKVV